MCVFTRMGTSSYNSLCLQGELRVLHVLILIRIHWLPCKRAETTEHGVWDTSDLHQEEMFPVQETITITPSMLQDKVAVSVNYPWGFCHANISCVIGVGEKKILGKALYRNRLLQCYVLETMLDHNEAFSDCQASGHRTCSSHLLPLAMCFYLTIFYCTSECFYRLPEQI